MKRNLFLGVGAFFLVASVGLVGCGDDDEPKKSTSGGGGTGGGTGGTGGSTGGSAGSSGGTAGAGGSGGGTLPTGQIDRIGRPAVATALIPSAKKDAYNQAAQTQWATYATDIESSLDALDNLDGQAGNSIAGVTGIGNAVLGGVLANDQLIIDISIDDCDGGYLAQEIATVTSTPATKCGGRTLSQDVVDVTLQALVDFGSPPGVLVSDDVDANDKAFTDTFPYLATPH